MEKKKRFSMLLAVSYKWEVDVEAENEVEAALTGYEFANKRLRESLPKGRVKHKSAGAMFMDQWLAVLGIVADIAKKQQAKFGVVDAEKVIVKAQKLEIKRRDCLDALYELKQKGKLKEPKPRMFRWVG